MSNEHHLIAPLSERLVRRGSELFLPPILAPEELLEMSDILRNSGATGEMEHTLFRKKIDQLVQDSAEATTIPLRKLYRDPNASPYVALHDTEDLAYIHIQGVNDNPHRGFISAKEDYLAFSLEVRTSYPGISREARKIKKALLDRGYPVFQPRANG